MKLTVLQPTEIEVKYIQVTVPVRYDDEDIPYDFPLRNGDQWTGIIELSTGKIENWPEDKMGHFKLSMKVCDGGLYQLIDKWDKAIGFDYHDYIPNKIIPGEFGDYIHLVIVDGIVTNWPTKLNPKDFQIFFSKSEENLY